MKSFSLLAIFFLSVDAAANAVDSGVQQGKTHPIDKVINMLEGLKAKSIMEGKKEGESYNKFAYWCSTSIDTLKDAIADEKEKIAELEDLLEGKNKEKEGLEKEIETLEEQIAEMEATAKKAKD